MAGKKGHKLRTIAYTKTLKKTTSAWPLPDGMT